ncbi:MAG TPA: YXWGXW repeat-containing protein [Polyangiaceae bacterium]|nr:YXWGXW repeat-containing protein [Polyangiaceae bacterium]
MTSVWLLVPAALVLACGSSIPAPRYAQQPTSALVEVDYPAPPARVEFVPARPTSTAVWVRGEWQWQGRRWAWKPGAWIEAPENASYAAWVEVRNREGKLFYASGTWRNAQGEEVSAPPPIRQARARSTTVVSADGEMEPTGEDVAPEKAP